MVIKELNCTRVMFQADWNMDVEEGLDGVDCG